MTSLMRPELTIAALHSSRTAVADPASFPIRPESTHESEKIVQTSGATFMVPLVMKRDGRSLDCQTQEAIRLMAIERIREGERPAEVIEAYGFNRTTVYKWIDAALRPGVSIKAPRSTKATGRPRSLTAKQEQQVLPILPTDE